MKIINILAFFIAFFAVNDVFSQTDSLSTENKGKVVVLNKSGFLKSVWNYEKNSDKWIYEGKLPCIIDFYAEWCGPCHKVSPILKDLAEEYSGKIIVYKIDVDKERELASIFQIKSIPAYLFIPIKGDPRTGLGASPRDFFVKTINDFLLKE
jgi:thioredoxin